MMISFSIFCFFLVQSTLANFEDSYPENLDNYNFYSEDFADSDEGDLEKRENHFMRFGRNNGDFKKKEYIYDDYEEPDLHVKRTGTQHIRYGRSGGHNNFMRYGRNPPKGRNKSMFMRIGRNFQDNEDKIRSKRSAPQTPPDPGYPKRKDHFMRFGKSPSFMRFGRNSAQASPYYFQNSAHLDQLSPSREDFIENFPKENQPLELLLAKLVARRQEMMKPFMNSI